jgi:hypothetical protein
MPVARTTWTTLQLDAPADGLLELAMSPCPFAATHIETDGHDSVTRAFACPSRSGRTRLTLQELGPPVGLVDVNTFPATSVATHNRMDGHATAENPTPGRPSASASTRAAVHLFALPSGSRDVITSPSKFTATHDEADGQDTALTNCWAGSACRVSRQTPEAGRVETAISPLPENATHSETEGQDTTGERPNGNTGRGALQAWRRRGRVVVVTSLLSNATHRREEGHATDQAKTDS